MPDQVGGGCVFWDQGEPFFSRGNMPQHSFAGANTWVIRAVAAQLGDPWLIWGAWIVGGLYALLGAVAVAELAAALRERYAPASGPTLAHRLTLYLPFQPGERDAWWADLLRALP